MDQQTIEIPPEEVGFLKLATDYTARRQANIQSIQRGLDYARKVQDGDELLVKSWKVAWDVAVSTNSAERLIVWYNTHYPFISSCFWEYHATRQLQHWRDANQVLDEKSESLSRCDSVLTLPAEPQPLLLGAHPNHDHTDSHNPSDTPSS